LVAGRSTTSY